MDQENKKNKRNMWVIKPGENSNRGNGVKVEMSFQKIEQLVKSYCQNTRTCIVQQYIAYPLLYQKRKFDIRCFCLITSINGLIKAYFYKEGYIRTASHIFSPSLNQVHNKYIHLVNDAVQKYCEDYGKYEAGNKITY